jgi:hypothetical protein
MNEERIAYALEVGIPRSLPDAQIAQDNPFYADDNYEVYANLMELREVARDIPLQLHQMCLPPRNKQDEEQLAQWLAQLPLSERLPFGF